MVVVDDVVDVVDVVVAVVVAGDGDDRLEVETEK